MLKIFKYLKLFWVSIIFIIGLLFIQAFSDLALPEYMAEIVNNGIQQYGIEDAVPNAIRKTEMEKIYLFLDKDKQDILSKDYTLLEKEKLSKEDYDKYVKDYPILKVGSIYKLNKISKEERKELNDFLGKPILMVNLINTGKLSQYDSSFANLPSNIDPFMVLKFLPAQQWTQMNEKINNQLKDIPDNMITQSAVMYIKAEYEKIGINIDELQKNYIIIAGLKMIGIALISMLTSIIVAFISARLSASLGSILRRDLFKKVTSFSNVEFDKFGSASLITRTTNDIQQIQMLMVMLLRIVFYAPILGVGGVIKVLATDTSMAWTIGVAVAAILVVVLVLFLAAIPKFKLIQKLIDKLNLVTRESLSGMLVIRAFNNEKYEEKKFNKANRDLTSTNLFVTRIMSTMMPIMMLIMNGITILIVWVGAHQIDKGAIQVGDMMAFIQYAMQIIMAFLMITMISIMLPRASVSAGRVAEVLNTEPAIKDPKDPKAFVTGQKGYITFANVSFKYPGASDYVIKNVSFEAKPGETTAFVGSTGCGKSTIVNLIPRFYDVTEGAILIDGINVREVPQVDLRNKIGYVPQKGILFSGDIASNLEYGHKNASDEELEAAAKIAQASDFIEAKEDKYHSHIAQGGSNVSGGQKQRLSIARAIIKRPEIYIFDDSFSALDFKTDAALRKALKTEIKESTVLIVAQRISTVMYANQIIVLENGEIVGKGTHDELMKDCKVYQEIALSQLSKEEIDHE